MAKTKLSNSKSICVLAVVVCCFAILWPKIFLPMLQSALSLTSPPEDNQRSDGIMLPPKVREAMKLSRPEELRRLSPGRHIQRDAKINTNDIPIKGTGGLMGFVMPLYTIGIIVFFLYTILKMVFSNKSDKEVEEDEVGEEVETVEQEVGEKPIIKDFQMDPEYRKFILNEEYDENGKRIKIYENPKRKAKLNANKCMQNTENVVQSFGKDKVSKALHILIRDMEEFKKKLLEVEQTKRQIREIGSKKNTSEDSLNKIQMNEENEATNETQNDLDKEDDQNVVKDNDDNENIENEGQRNSDTDLDDETNDENNVNENDDYLNPQEEYELKENILKNLESDYWESLLKEMCQLKNTKEE